MSEHGFYHPSIGYWQTNGEPSGDVLEQYPQGTVEVTICPGAGYAYDGEQWVDVPPPELSFEEKAAAIEAEFEKKKSTLSARLATTTLVNGASEDAKRAAIQAEYIQLCAGKAEALDALLFGV